MRSMKVLLFLLPLALLQPAVTFALTAPQAAPQVVAPAVPQAAPMTQQELLAGLFGNRSVLPEANILPSGGLCSVTCDRCWSNSDCPPIGTYHQTCAFACN